MKLAACSLFLSLAFGVAQAAPADDDHVALFKNVTGSMKIVRASGVVEATPGALLFTNDRVVSGIESSAGITFKDGTLVTVGPSTEIHVRDYVFAPKEAKYKFDLYLAKGSAIYSSGKIGKVAPDAVKVDTPTATVGVRGTRFIVNAE